METLLIYLPKIKTNFVRFFFVGVFLGSTSPNATSFSRFDLAFAPLQLKDKAGNPIAHGVIGIANNRA